MSVSAILVIIVFGIIFLSLVVMAVIHVFHAWRFGEHTPLAALTSGMFFLGIVFITTAVVVLLRDVDWQQSFEVTLPFVSEAPNNTTDQ